MSSELELYVSEEVRDVIAEDMNKVFGNGHWTLDAYSADGRIADVPEKWEIDVLGDCICKGPGDDHDPSCHEDEKIGTVLVENKIRIEVDSMSSQRYIDAEPVRAIKITKIEE